MSSTILDSSTPRSNSNNNQPSYRLSQRRYSFFSAVTYLLLVGNLSATPVYAGKNDYLAPTESRIVGDGIGKSVAGRKTRFGPEPAQATIFRDNTVFLQQPNVMEAVYAVDVITTDLQTANNKPFVNGDDVLDWESFTINKGDTLSAVFKKIGFDPADAIKIAAADQQKTLNNLTVGKKIDLLRLPTGEFGGMRYEVSPLRRLEVRYHQDSGLIIDLVDREPDAKEVHEAFGFIESSLYDASEVAGINPVVTAKLAKIFGYEIDFAMDLRRGDRFSVIYEQKFFGDNQTSDGDILAAEFINKGKVHRAIRFVDGHGTSNYYTPDGYSLRRAFFRSPVKFTRITSSFSKRRYHPILKKWKAHRGVDYAAAKGTPVMATADGVITHRTAMGGYGRTVIVKHGKKYKTLYAHLSAYRKGQSVGTRVRQGSVIGYVGQTGSATGPHLHYEFRVDNKHRNPLTVISDQEPTQRISDEYFHDFRDKAVQFSSRLDALNAEIAENESEESPDRS